MLLQVLQPLTAGLTSAVPLLEQTAWVPWEPGKCCQVRGSARPGLC